jgi:hypothetical protein
MEKIYNTEVVIFTRSQEPNADAEIPDRFVASGKHTQIPIT